MNNQTITMLGALASLVAASVSAHATPLKVDISTLGAVPSSTLAADMDKNSKVIQDALDSNPGADAYIPGGTYYISKPIFMQSNGATIEGAGAGVSYIKADPNRKAMPLILNAYYNEQPYAQIDSDARPSSASFLDGSTGTIYGLRTTFDYPSPGSYTHQPTLAGRGAWATGISYIVGDAVTQQNGAFGATYICIVANTSSSTNQPETGASWTTNWVRRTQIKPIFVGGAFTEGALLNATTGQTSRFVSGMANWTLEMAVRNNGSTSFLSEGLLQGPKGVVSASQQPGLINSYVDDSYNLKVFTTLNDGSTVGGSLSATGCSFKVTPGETCRLAVQSNTVAGVQTITLYGTDSNTGHTVIGRADIVPAGKTVTPMDSGDLLTPLNTDCTLLGLHFSNTARYTTGTTGTLQSRADSGTINDQYRYFTNDTNTIAYLPLTDNWTGSPSDPTSDVWRYGRLISVQQGAAAAGATQLEWGLLTTTGWPGISNQSIHDLSIQNTPTGTITPYGIAIYQGFFLPTQFYNLDVRGGSYGFGEAEGGANKYVEDISNCTMQGTEAAYYGNFQTVVATNCTIATPGRDAIFFIDGNPAWTNTVVGSTGYDTSLNENIFRYNSGGNGGTPIVDTLNVINSNTASYPTKAAFFMSYDTFVTPVSFTIRNATVNALPTTAAFLETGDGTYKYNTSFTVENSSVAHGSGGNADAFIRSGTSHFFARVSNCLNTFPVNSWVSLTGPVTSYALSNVLCYHYDLTTFPPTTHTWLQDGSVAYYNSAPSGTYREWHVTGSGVGTASTWKGTNPAP